MINEEAGNYDYLLRYIITGDVSVGKSNILLRYVHGQFRSDYNSTVGVEFGAKSEIIGDNIYRVQIWDTTGQESFRSITRTYFKSSACALIVYDISSRESFKNVNIWINECKNQTAKTTFLVLVGNKSDLEDRREVSTEEGQQLAGKYGILFFETSAKTGDNVNELFHKSVEEIAQKIEQNYYELDNKDCGITVGKNRLNKQVENKKGGPVKLGDVKTPKKRKCCK